MQHDVALLRFLCAHMSLMRLSEIRMLIMSML